MTHVLHASKTRSGAHRLVIRELGPEQVGAAFRKGLDDFRQKPSHYVFLCLVYPLMGLVIGLWTSGNEALPSLFPLVGGFALLGPIAALGLYEISRRREAGLDTAWRHAFDVLRSPSIVPIAALGVVLMAIFFCWIMSAQALFDWAFAGQETQSVPGFVADLFGTARGWTLIVVGNLVGLGFALVTLCISVVSFPLLLDRPVSLLQAVETSLRVTARNPKAVLLWGLIVGTALFAGSIPLFAGLAVAVPVLGHATWHLYRAAVEPEANLSRSD
ncbi:hypothetical protein Sa4125_21640 [Aureimonas sp. SA4125]|uniref:DUF2189 domain-containing protein n=1 Tax=Aureimonas sp. SA4125 TaxID=2826993 RepID=UPI001CC52D32|nr:DUF2189 domain-containing protein [Aureimonas sp. SA4125]BDA84622.1 hypothetical protein Sa4125_21640 [Aureimonas sp. SA4125]